MYQKVDIAAISFVPKKFDLEENADRIDGISGATILGDGQVSLILDIGSLCRLTDEIPEHLLKEAA